MAKVIKSDATLKDITLGGIESSDFPLTIEFSKPVVVGDTSTNKVTIQNEPLADIAMFIADTSSQGAGTSTVLGMERWSGLDEGIIRKLSIKDFKIISGVMNYFLGDGEE